MSYLHLRNASSSLLLVVDATGARIVHWGALIVSEPPPDAFIAGGAGSAHDIPFALGLVPLASSGWRGKPGLVGSSASGFSPTFTAFDWTGDDSRAEVWCEDRILGLKLTTFFHLEANGLLRICHRLENLAGADFRLGALGVAIPIPDYAREVLDLAGRWSREQHPQRFDLQQGSWVREGRHGRTGHDSSAITLVGRAGFTNRTGEVWGIHLGWSGNHEVTIESTSDPQTVLTAAELLGPGEIVLAVGDVYQTPWVYAAYSDHGIDGISNAFHAWVRSRPEHPRSPRPVVLNSWEAVYFKHDLQELTEIVDAAAAVGVEQFVLDDGWFVGRRDDSAGLGDWTVDSAVWPSGLSPLIDHVRKRGMRFGLWVEPEMVNQNSRVARAHPEWICMSSADRLPLTWRNQQVLDLVNPDAWAYVFEKLNALLSEYPIDYLKWDQNRDLLDMGHRSRPSTHHQTLAAYRLLDSLRSAHPAVEIESCSSGGGRVDLGILEHTDRVWTSDTNDALERQTIQRWTQSLLPLELTGSHIGPAASHTTGRTHTLAFRAVTALFGSLGIEWDIRSLSALETSTLSAVVETYKRLRPLLHTGTLVHADVADPSTMVHGVVAADTGEAIFAFVQLTTSDRELPDRLRLPGLAHDRVYRIHVEPLGPLEYTHRRPPPWLATGIEMDGRGLEVIGLPMPGMRPEQALLLTVTAIDREFATGTREGLVASRA